MKDLMNHKNENEDTNDSSNNYKLFSIIIGNIFIVFNFSKCVSSKYT